jgi:hypothetical protein
MKSKGLTYGTDKLEVYGYADADADWVRDLETRWSTTGYMNVSAMWAVPWASKYLLTIVLSIIEGEYMSVNQAMKEPSG